AQQQIQQNQPQNQQPPMPQGLLQSQQGPNLASMLAQFQNPAGQQQQGVGQSYGQQQQGYDQGSGQKRDFDGSSGGYGGADDTSNKRFCVNGDSNKPKKHVSSHPST